MSRFTSADARRHKSDLVDSQVQKWVAIAERVYAMCTGRPGSDARECERMAILRANAMTSGTVRDSGDLAFVFDSGTPTALAEFAGEMGEPVVDEAGILRAPVVLSQEGVLPYIVDGRVESWFIPKEELSAQEFIDSLNAKPVTDGHPAEEAVSMDTLPIHAKGALVGPFQQTVSDDGRLQVRGFEIVWDKDLVADLMAGKKRQVSMGRWARVVDEKGTWRGQPYQKVQRGLRFNHLAHTDRGRQGDACRILIDMMEPDAVDARLRLIGEQPLVERCNQLIAFADEALADPATVDANVVSALTWRVRDAKRTLRDAIALGGEGVDLTGFEEALAKLNARFPDITGDSMEFDAGSWAGVAEPHLHDPENFARCLPPPLENYVRLHSVIDDALPVDFAQYPIRRQPGAPINVAALRALGGDGAAFAGLDQAVADSTREWCRTELQRYEKRGDGAVPKTIELKIGDTTLALGTAGLSDAEVTALEKTAGAFQKAITDTVTERDGLKGQLATATQKVTDAEAQIARMKSEQSGLADQVKALGDEMKSFKDKSAVDPAQIAQTVSDEVQERATLVLVGRQVVGDAFDTKASAAGMRRAIVAARFPKEAEALNAQANGAHVKDDAYIGARYDSIRDELEQAIGQPVGAGMVRPRQPIGDSKKDPLEEAAKKRLAMFKGRK